MLQTGADTRGLLWSEIMPKVQMWEPLAPESKMKTYELLGRNQMRNQGLEQEENQNGQRVAWYPVARNTFQHFCIWQIFIIYYVSDTVWGL